MRNVERRLNDFILSTQTSLWVWSSGPYPCSAKKSRQRGDPFAVSLAARTFQAVWRLSLCFRTSRSWLCFGAGKPGVAIPDIILCRFCLKLDIPFWWSNVLLINSHVHLVFCSELRKFPVIWHVFLNPCFPESRPNSRCIFLGGRETWNQSKVVNIHFFFVKLNLLPMLKCYHRYHPGRFRGDFSRGQAHSWSHEGRGKGGDIRQIKGEIDCIPRGT